MSAHTPNPAPASSPQSTSSGHSGTFSAHATADILERGKKVLIGNYARQPFCMDRGEGALLWDTDGRQYIDLFAGFGGGILGHSHPELVNATVKQARRLWHVGNTFYTEPQIEFAERLNRYAFPGQAFFCHSGLEANEAACKLARLYGKPNGKWKILSLNKSFHGRSLAMISATGNPKTKAGFEPMVPGFTQVDGGNIDLLAAAADKETAAILMEPIQGEGGINVYPDGYAAAVRKLCDERGMLLIFDEVWTGCGRTGKWFGYQHFCTKASPGAPGTPSSPPPPLAGASASPASTATPPASMPVLPDIMTLGKAIGGGLPVGAMFAKPDIAAVLTPSTHGSTLGGNPICMEVAKTIFDIIQRDGLIAQAIKLGEAARARLAAEPRLKGKIADVRGKGLMLGIELSQPQPQLVSKGLEHGVLLNLTADKVVRVAPPLNIPEHLFQRGLDLMIDTLASL